MQLFGSLAQEKFRKLIFIFFVLSSSYSHIDCNIYRHQLCVTRSDPRSDRQIKIGLYLRSLDHVPSSISQFFPVVSMDGITGESD